MASPRTLSQSSAEICRASRLQFGIKAHLLLATVQINDGYSKASSIDAGIVCLVAVYNVIWCQVMILR